MMPPEITHPERIILHTRRGGTWTWRSGMAAAVLAAGIVALALVLP